MGALYSRQKATISNDYLGVSESDGGGGSGSGVGGVVEGTAMPKKPKDVPILQRKSIDLLSQQEMEQEFLKIYQTSQHMLNSLTHNPCEQLALRIQQCLQSNSQDMSNCFGIMNSYQSCLVDQRQQRLLKGMRDLEMY